MLPGFTRSEFHDGADMGRSMPGFFWMTSKEVAEAALVAVERGKAICVPGLGYRALVVLSRHAPGPGPTGGGDGRAPDVSGDGGGWLTARQDVEDDRGHRPERITDVAIGT